MRISDWSSDVCSSDLFLHRPADTDAQRAGMRSEIAVIMTAALADAAAPAIEPDERAENDVGCCQSGMVCRLLRGPEIGRASCRESVCQYVSISVVAGSLKKKTNDT